MECLTAADGFIRIRYRSALSRYAPFHSISIPFPYRPQLHSSLLPRESYRDKHFLCSFVSISKLTGRWKTRGMIFIICRVSEVTRQAMNRFPIFELILWIKEPSRVPGKWTSLIKLGDSNAYHLKGGLNFTVQTVPLGDEGEKTEGRFIMRRVLVLKVSILRIREGQY